jgi:YidC/Oxa1 family membrane protein insertase
MIAEIRKYVLYFILAVLGVSLWNAWHKEFDQTAKPAVVSSSQNTTASDSSSASDSHSATSYTPKAYKSVNLSQLKSSDAPKEASAIAAGGQLVKVKTDLFDLAINLNTGNLVDLSLVAYPASLKDKSQPFQLLTSDKKKLYVSQSGLIDADGKPIRVTYSSASTSYEMPSDKNQLDVVLKGQTAEGVQLQKIYTFRRDHYTMDVKYVVDNGSKLPWSGSFYGQVTRRPQDKSGLFSGYRAYYGASLSSPAKHYEKIKYDWLAKNMISRDVTGGWLAVQQQYFLTAWIPSADESNHYYSHTFFHTNSEGKPANAYTLGFVTPQLALNPGKTGALSARFYAGPEIADRLKQIAPGLDLTIDYGWLWPLSKAIFWVMDHIHDVVGNWGWSIILVTLLIKLAFYKLSESSYRSMARMRTMAPQLQALKDRFGDDKQKLSQETMALYKREKVNPAGGCLPMLIQVPFFIALYYVLIESVQLRQAPFIFWIHDLSVKDPYYVLPILMGISMFIQQKMTPAPMEKAQARAMMLLPVLFTVMFLNFPAGLTLYWLTNNCLTILQQWHVMRRVDHGKSKPSKKK